MAEQSGAQPDKLDWPEMYAAGFEVLREGPSIVTSKLIEQLGPERIAAGRVLDVGCGTLRNSVYVAEYGATVEAIDVADQAYVLESIDPAIRRRINFRTGRVQDHVFERDNYDAVICTRLIQYLSPDDCEQLLIDLGRAVRRGGGLALNYTVSGGLVGDERMPADTFSHSPDTVRRLLKNNGLLLRSYALGEGPFSVYAPAFENPDTEPLTCDIVALKR